MQFTRLFEPIIINRLTVKNRIVMPAMALAYAEDYSFSDRLKAFYTKRAEGGVGLMIVGPFAIDRVGSAPSMPGLFHDKYVRSLRHFTDYLHKDSDVKIGIQFMHMGRLAPSSHTGIIPIAPSPIASKLTGEIPREMTRDDIHEVQQAYVCSSQRAVDAGFDYLEILMNGSYLIGEFLSALTNRRTDEYGGGVQQRMRFGLEVIGKVRHAVGNDVAMGIRISGHDLMEAGNTNAEAALFAAEAERAGANSINVTGGWHESYIPQITTAVPPGAFLYLSRGVKEKVTVPVFASHRLGDPVVAENALRSGHADMICWGRPLIADPDLPAKVKAGSFDDAIRCIACNQGCFDQLLSGSSVYCVLNPLVGREADIQIKETTRKKRVYVAGGGPAGMEFAWVAKRRGHDVTLYEKEECLGGQINLLAVCPGKKEFCNVVQSLQNRLKGSGVKVRTGTALTLKVIEEDEPDVVVVASGAEPTQVGVPGINRTNVVSAWDVLSGKASNVGKQVVIIGGGATGCETALFVAHVGVPSPESFAFLLYHSVVDLEGMRRLLYDSGRDITVIEALDRMASDMGISSRWPLMKDLRLMGVRLRTRTKLLEITKDSVLVEIDEGKDWIPADTVIIAVGSQSIDDLAAQANSGRTEVITIGDAKEPRKIGDAIREGFDLALRI